MKPFSILLPGAAFLAFMHPVVLHSKETAAPADPSMPVIQPEVIYGRKAGMALTYDIIKPAQPNGAAVLFMVSGGWVSGWSDPKPMIKQAWERRDHNAFGMLLDKGFSLILVRHGSSPWFKVPDAVADVRLAVRHVRAHAADHGLDPERLGVFGGSAGGHLSLMLGTTAESGAGDAADATGNTGNRVAAVAAYYPPTDLDGYINDQRFPALHFPEDQSAKYSPLKHVSADDAPSLLVHGGRDTLVPISHSENIMAAFKKAGVPAELLVFPEAAHSFTGDDEKAAATAVTRWFEKYLAKKPDPDNSPEGFWEAVAVLPDGTERPATITIRPKEGGWEAIADGDQGERKIDRVQWDAGRLTLEVDMERDGLSGLIRVKASTTGAGKLTGTWSAEDSSGMEVGTGEWKASKNSAAK